MIADIIEIFRRSRNNDGTRKIRNELRDLGQVISRHRIGRIMKQESFISNYTIAQFKPHVTKCNEDKINHVINRDFNN